MQAFLNFFQAHKLYFDAVHAVGSVLNLLAWCLAALLLHRAFKRSRVESVSFGPISFRLKQEAVEATARAARAWKSVVPKQSVDVSRIRRTVDQAFSPGAADNLVGKAIVWVDDNPTNNELAVRALRKFQLEIEQVTSTEAALTALQRRPFDLVISDMGRGDNMRAGYELLKLIRDQGNRVPYFIFAGSDSQEHREEARQRGAQLSTNDMLELVDCVVQQLGSSH